MEWEAMKMGSNLSSSGCSIQLKAQTAKSGRFRKWHTRSQGCSDQIKRYLRRQKKSSIKELCMQKWIFGTVIKGKNERRNLTNYFRLSIMWIDANREKNEFCEGWEREEREERDLMCDHWCWGSYLNVGISLLKTCLCNMNVGLWYYQMQLGFMQSIHESMTLRKK